MTRRKKSLSRDDVVAYHEAGHVVAHFILGRGIGNITIEPSGRAAGHVTSRKRTRFSPDSQASGWEETRTRREVEREILTFMAGDAAERLAGGPCRGSEEDITHAYRLAEPVCDPPTLVRRKSGDYLRASEECDAYIAWLRARAAALVRRDWYAVEALVRVLRKTRTLNGRQARRVLMEARLAHFGIDEAGRRSLAALAVRSRSIQRALKSTKASEGGKNARNG